MKNAIILLLLIIFAASCGGQKTASVEQHTTVKDSTVVTFKPVDTIITVPEEKVRIEVPVSELNEVPLVKKGERTTLSISMIGEVLSAECKAEQLERKIQLMEKTIARLRSTTTDRTETIIQEVKYVPWYIKTLAWIGGITLLVFGIRFAYNFYKPKFL